jgi:hypothetical protein
MGALAQWMKPLLHAARFSTRNVTREAVMVEAETKDRQQKVRQSGRSGMKTSGEALIFAARLSTWISPCKARICIKGGKDIKKTEGMMLVSLETSSGERENKGSSDGNEFPRLGSLEQEQSEQGKDSRGSRFRSTL